LMLMFAINLISLASMGQVQSVKELGDSAYLKGEMDSAIVAYESILAQEYRSAEVYFNLGNAYYKKEDISNTILNYERALKLAPHDEDIQFNLRLANLRTVGKIEAVPEFKLFTVLRNLYQQLALDTWAWLGVSFALLGSLMLIFYFRSTNPFLKKLGFFSSFLAFACMVFTLYQAQTAYTAIHFDARAVIMQPTLNVKSSPDLSGNDLFVIHEGMVVKVVDETLGWKRIKLVDGNVGWVPGVSLEGI
jgi:tetratricopeptide (TPR) repeat protein